MYNSLSLLYKSDFGENKSEWIIIARLGNPKETGER